MNYGLLDCIAIDYKPVNGFETKKSACGDSVIAIRLL